MLSVDPDRLHLQDTRWYCNDLSYTQVHFKRGLESTLVRTVLLEYLALITALPDDSARIGFHHIPRTEVYGQFVRCTFEEVAMQQRQHTWRTVRIMVLCGEVTWSPDSLVARDPMGGETCEVAKVPRYWRRRQNCLGCRYIECAWERKGCGPGTRRQTTTTRSPIVSTVTICSRPWLRQMGREELGGDGKSAFQHSEP